MKKHQCEHCRFFVSGGFCQRHGNYLQIEIMTRCDLARHSNEPTWEELINRLDDIICSLRESEPPPLAYRDAYDKLLDAAAEFSVAHYG